MSTYMFHSEAAMKDYNYKKYWIDRDIVEVMSINADNLKDAIKEYQRRCDEQYITISNTALNKKEPMFVGDKQVGFVFTAKTNFYNRNGVYAPQYINLWVKIVEVVDVDFETA